MATFLVGVVIGAYTGAMIREEHYFPTIDKIRRAYEVYKKNEIVIAEVEAKAKNAVQDKPKS